MSKCCIRVTASCRLHFGLMALGDSAERKFGGVGVMIEPPHTRLNVSAADRLTVHGPAADRVTKFVHCWQNFHGLTSPPACRIEVKSLPQLHSGLGVGTQLGLSIAAALNVVTGIDGGSPEQLASSVGRGQRSAIGTYGFFEGGIIADRGKSPTDTLAPLNRHATLPETWRFVLVCPKMDQGLHGEVEHRAFGAIPPVPPNVVAALSREIDETIFPAAAEGDFNTFCDGVYRFGHQSGLNFAAVQGGAYNGPRLTALVQRIRSMGVRGVGQSSWGPTIFAVCENNADADSLVAALHDESDQGTIIRIASPCNHGAKIERDAEP